MAIARPPSQHGFSGKSQKKRSSLKLAVQLQIIKDTEAKRKSQADIARDLGLSKSMLGTVRVIRAPVLFTACNAVDEP